MPQRRERLLPNFRKRMLVVQRQSDQRHPFCRRLRRVSALLAGLAVALIALAPASDATWSVVGVDPNTGEVGVAIASCVESFFLGDLDAPLDPVVLVPGVGSGVSQAELNAAAPAEIARQLETGQGAEQAIAAVVAASFDARSAARQHAVVTLDGTAAAFTGVENMATAGDRVVEHGSIQGNIVVSDKVLDDAAAAFQDSAGDLASRLVSALQAGADAGGDARCEQQTALFAQLVVAQAGDDPARPSILLTFAVDEGSGENPVELLSAAFADGQRNTVSDTGGVPNVIWAILGVGILLLVALISLLIWFRRRSAHT